MTAVTPQRVLPRPWLGGWHLLVPIVALALCRELWAPDEPRYAQIAREAFESGSLLVLHLCGDVYPDKPPLVYWIAGLFGKLGGWTEFAMRLPLILATVGSALLAVRIARRHLSETAAAWTPLFYLGTAMVVWFGGRLQIDPLLAFFCLAAIDLAWNDGGDASQRTRRLLLAGLCTGLAALCKGPVAWVHVGLALAALRFVPRAARSPARFQARAWAGFIVLAILPVVSWAVAASLREPKLWKPLFLGQHLARMTSEESPHAGPPWEHLWQMPALFLPWTGFMILGLVEAARAWRRTSGADVPAQGLVRMSAWFAAVLVVFSAMPPKRELYLLPIYPAGAWFAAVAFERALASGRLVRWATLSASALFLLSGVFAFVVQRVVPVAEPYASSAWTVGVPLFAGGVASIAFLLRGNLARWADAMALGLSGAGLAAAIWVVPAVDTVKSARSLAEIVAQRPEKPERIPCVGVQPEGFRFYGRVPTVRAGPDALLAQLERDGRSCLALISQNEWERATQALRARFTILREQRVGARKVYLLGRAPTASGS
jgi:4-amino-4-deoxy-L-arabinose transferase-like glycosyltransferase